MKTLQSPRPPLTLRLHRADAVLLRFAAEYAAARWEHTASPSRLRRLRVLADELGALLDATGEEVKP